MTAQPEQNILPRASSGTRTRTTAAQINTNRRAPFALRCGALLVDYALLIAILALSTLVARLLGGGTRMAGGAAETIGVLIAIGAGLLNFVLFAGASGVTLGKWATGLRIEQTTGGELGFGRALVRHLIGYPLSLIVFGIGFLLAAFDSQGRGLHDRLAGTLVVRDAEQRRRLVR